MEFLPVLLGMSVGLAAGAGVMSFLRRRPGGEPPARVERHQIRQDRVGLAEDPIVEALGVRHDEAAPARRLLGRGLHAPPEDSPPPT